MSHYFFFVNVDCESLIFFSSQTITLLSTYTNYSENALHNESGIFDMNTTSITYNTLECQKHDK